MIIILLYFVYLFIVECSGVGGSWVPTSLPGEESGGGRASCSAACFLGAGLLPFCLTLVTGASWAANPKAGEGTSTERPSPVSYVLVCASVHRLNGASAEEERD